MAKRQQKQKKESPRYVFTGHEQLPDSYTEITGVEITALLSVKSTDARWIYLYLSFHRNFETGITGLNPKISSAMLRQSVSHKSDVGIKERKISNNHIQRWLDQLEYAGLIENRGNHVFYLPLARKHTRKEKISNSSCNSFEEKSVTVTKPVTSSSSNLSETPKNTEQNENKEVLPNMLQNTSLSQGNSAEVSHILLPIQNNNYTKLNYTELPIFLSTDENKFLNLFTDLKLSLNLAGDLKAITTAKALVQAGVTLEEAREALKIKLAAYKGDRTPHPSYFKQAILDYKRDLEAIKPPPQESNNHANHTTRPTHKGTGYEQVRKRLAKWAEKREQEKQDGLESDCEII